LGLAVGAVCAGALSDLPGPPSSLEISGPLRQTDPIPWNWQSERDIRSRAVHAAGVLRAGLECGRSVARGGQSPPSDTGVTGDAKNLESFAVLTHLIPLGGGPSGHRGFDSCYPANRRGRSKTASRAEFS
jgi:hypothetical protein